MTSTAILRAKLRPANLIDLVQHPDERRGIEDSYARTGDGRSMDDFLRDHVSLYNPGAGNAPENDPRHAGIFFYGDTLSRLNGAIGALTRRVTP